MDDLYTLLARVEADSVVLDLGCGHGSFHYEKCRGRIVAMDIALPDNANPAPHVTYVRGDSCAIPLRAALVDVVVSHHTLEHFTDYQETLNEIRRVLNPKGWLWIAVPNGYGFDDALYRFVFAGGGHVNRFEYQTLFAKSKQPQKRDYSARAICSAVSSIFAGPPKRSFSTIQLEQDF